MPLCQCPTGAASCACAVGVRLCVLKLQNTNLVSKPQQVQDVLCGDVVLHYPPANVCEALWPALAWAGFMHLPKQEYKYK